MSGKRLIICNFLNILSGSQYTFNKTFVPSMIHSARPTVPPVAITILTWKWFCFAIFWKADGQTPRTKIVITTGRDCGSASWFNYTFLQAHLLLSLAVLHSLVPEIPSVCSNQFGGSMGMAASCVAQSSEPVVHHPNQIVKTRYYKFKTDFINLTRDQLIHEADLQSWPWSRQEVITIFTHVVRPSLLFKLSQNKPFPSENNDLYWRDYESGLEDHWWHMSYLSCFSLFNKN